MSRLYPRDMLDPLPPVDEVLFRAVREKDHDTLRAHLAAGNAADQVDDDNNTPLFLALKAKDIVAVRILLDAGADVDEGQPYSCDSPLRLALQNQCKDTVRLLLERGADPGFFSVGDGVETPEGKKCREKPVSDLTVSKEGDPEIAAMCEEAFQKFRAVYAVSGGLEQSRTASYRCDVDVVRKMLAEGAPVDIKDENDRTALMYACIRRDLPMIKMLLEEFHANPEVVMKDGEATALYFAVNGRHPVPDTAVIKLLVEHGADVRKIYQNGNTIMHYAATSGDADTMKTLAVMGVSLTSRGKDGATPLDAALEYGLKPEDVTPVMEGVKDWWKQELEVVCQRATRLENDVKPMRTLALRAPKA